MIIPLLFCVFGFWWTGWTQKFIASISTDSLWRGYCLETSPLLLLRSTQTKGFVFCCDQGNINLIKGISYHNWSQRAFSGVCSNRNNIHFHVIPWRNQTKQVDVGGCLFIGKLPLTRNTRLWMNARKLLFHKDALCLWFLVQQNDCFCLREAVERFFFKPRAPPERQLAKAAYLSHHAIIVVIVIAIVIGIDVI